jgi:hypothetical protein
VPVQALLTSRRTSGTRPEMSHHLDTRMSPSELFELQRIGQLSALHAVGHAIVDPPAILCAPSLLAASRHSQDLDLGWVRLRGHAHIRIHVPVVSISIMLICSTSGSVSSASVVKRHAVVIDLSSVGFVSRQSVPLPMVSRSLLLAKDPTQIFIPHDQLPRTLGIRLSALDSAVC